MIRAEKHEVESIAASCATGLERAWAENDRLLLRHDAMHECLRNMAADAYDTRNLWAAVSLALGYALGFVSGVFL